ncbi:hypothetical protein J2S43_001402 [Catenuloplanes nepalensis]|uniref:Uncharacterized protein n=1 Tax=Catenuloplanes nepalensis TaxID=587533 RepID=A0ABT9MN84_9ACTN|nr:hypothetical protein [Catenuloplanes nepalensis]MDP9792890.1 hypothetical protein [Catenuloplanes nepalensis]
MSSIYDVTTWESLIQLMRAGNGADGPVGGHVSSGGWSVPGPHRDWNTEYAAVHRVCDALTNDGLENISFVLDRSSLHLIDTGPAVDGLGTNAGSLLLVEGAVAEPWRRLPSPTPGAAVSPSADPALLERQLVGGFAGRGQHRGIGGAARCAGNASVAADHQAFPNTSARSCGS